MSLLTLILVDCLICTAALTLYLSFLSVINYTDMFFGCGPPALSTVIFSKIYKPSLFLVFALLILILSADPHFGSILIARFKINKQ